MQDRVDRIRLPWELSNVSNDVPCVDDKYSMNAPADVVKANEETLLQWTECWINNARGNCRFIDEDFAIKGERLNAWACDASVARPDLAVVCASGASLDTYAPYLRDFPGLVICGPTNAASVCGFSGRLPYGIVAIDSGPGTILALKQAPFDDLGVHLLTSTTIDPAAAALFPVNRQWFNSIIQMEQGAQHPYNIFIKMLFSPISAWMYQAGCTSNAELLYLSMLQEMLHMRFRAIFLLGFDFAYRKNASRCSSFRYDNGIWSPSEVSTSRTSIQTRARIVRSRNGYVTDESMLGYKRSLLTVWRLSALRLYNCSVGIINELPNADFARLAEKEWKELPPEYDQQLISDTYSRYFKETGFIAGKTQGNEGEEISGDLWG